MFKLTDMRRMEVYGWVYHWMHEHHWADFTTTTIMRACPAPAEEIRQALRDLERLGYVRETSRGRWSWLPAEARGKG